METPICDFVAAYRQQDAARLHMPGHKGALLLGCEGLDITEIAGADELYAPSGILAQSEENASRLFGFGKTIYGTEGSSQCIRAMLFLAMQHRPESAERPLVLAARNAHKAFLYSCALLDLDVEWLMPEEFSSLCTCRITPKQVAQKLAEGKRPPLALYLTAPDYLGYSPDIRGIAAVCQRAGIPLLVDNAHGAYLKFLQPSAHPIDLGAAMSCDSAHKTLPVLTGGAYLHFSQEWAQKAGNFAKKAMELFGSTSPSYLILQSLDACNAYLADGYAQELAQTISRLDALRRILRRHGWRMAKSDPLKLTIFTGEMGYRGQEVSEILRKNGVECEFADLDAVVLMATPQNREEDFRRIEKILCSTEKKAGLAPLSTAFVLPPRRMRIREAIFSPWEEIDCTDAVGRICAAPCVSCPPAIPIVVSGEEITPQMAQLCRIYGTERIAVVKEWEPTDRKT